MNLGMFSISLAVKDLDASIAFYAKLGFSPIAPRPEWQEEYASTYKKNWVILEHDGPAVIGLFQGLFDTNTLTFNPADVRAVQRVLKEQGVELTMEADESTEGPGAAMCFDPDGNPILLDQHE